MGIVDFYEDISKPVKYAILAMIISAGAGYGYHLHKKSNNLSNQVFQQINSLQSSIPIQDQQYKTEEHETYSSSPCSHNSKCSLPNGLENRVILCEDPAIHCRGGTDTDHEQIIGYNFEKRVPYLNQNIKESYVDQDSVRISGLEGKLKEYEGKVLDGVFFLVTDENDCKSKIINPGQQIPEDFGNNMSIILFGKEVNQIYQIASVYTGNLEDNRGNNNEGGNNGCGQQTFNICCNSCPPTQTQPIPAPAPAVNTNPLPVSTPEHRLNSLEDYVAPTLIDNAMNEVAFRTGVRYEEIYLAFCEGGTDGKGKVITPCTKDRRIDSKIFPEAIIFEYVSTDENDPNIHTHRAKYIPNIPGTEESTYRMIGYKLNGNVYLEDIPEFSAAVQNTNPKSRVQP